MERMKDEPGKRTHFGHRANRGHGGAAIRGILMKPTTNHDFLPLRPQRTAEAATENAEDTERSAIR
jgi:hypothetical protein